MATIALGIAALISLWTACLFYLRLRELTELLSAQDMKEAHDPLKEEEVRQSIQNISHDLRTPITAAYGYLETLIMKNESLSVEERLKYLEKTKSNIERIKSMVSKMFDHSKQESAIQSLRLESFSIKEISWEIVESFRRTAESKGLELVLSTDEHIPLVSGNIELIERVLTNLLDNAVYYTPSGGKIELSLAIGGDGVEVSVSDSGIGIPQEDLPHIFDRFYRVDKARARETGGMGLGLTIVKEILDAHGSPIDVTSSVGAGTSFRFILPVFEQ